MEQVPLFDLGRVLEPLLGDAMDVFGRLTRAGDFTLGPALKAFEQSFARFCGAPYCVGVSDGTTALRLALLALGVEPGERVLTAPNTFVGTVEAIAAAGARPAFVDADPVSRCIDVAQLEVALAGDVAAVIPVHLFGRMAPMAQIMAVCARTGVRVLEDAAQAHGATLHGQRAGAWGDAGAFSFYPTKNLGGWGDGGAVLCHSREVAETVRSLRHHGSATEQPNSHVRCGSTARLDNLQAALLALRLGRLQHENVQRRRAATLYRELLSGLPVGLPPDDEEGATQVYHLFVIEVAHRDRVMSALRAAGIGTGVHYPTPVHLQPAWRWLGYGPGDFPVAEQLAKTSLSLPCFPGITDREQALVASALAAALRRPRVGASPGYRAPVAAAVGERAAGAS